MAAAGHPARRPTRGHGARGSGVPRSHEGEDAGRLASGSRPVLYRGAARLPTRLELEWEALDVELDIETRERGRRGGAHGLYLAALGSRLMRHGAVCV